MKSPAAISLVTFLLVLSGSALAQQTPPEPATVGVVHLLNSTANSIAPLEKQTATVRVRFSNITAEVKGERSPVRLKADAKQEFVVTPPTGVDPSHFEIYSMAGKNGKRQGSLVKDKPPASPAGAGKFQVNASKYGQASYKLVPAQTLPPGEYCLIPTGAVHDLYCFGIE
jgi:hypothetical protein